MSTPEGAVKAAVDVEAKAPHGDLVAPLAVLLWRRAARSRPLGWPSTLNLAARREMVGYSPLFVPDLPFPLPSGSFGEIVFINHIFFLFVFFFMKYLKVYFDHPNQLVSCIFGRRASWTVDFLWFVFMSCVLISLHEWQLSYSLTWLDNANAFFFPLPSSCFCIY